MSDTSNSNSASFRNWKLNSAFDNFERFFVIFFLLSAIYHVVADQRIVADTSLVVFVAIVALWSFYVTTLRGYVNSTIMLLLFIVAPAWLASAWADLVIILLQNDLIEKNTGHGFFVRKHDETSDDSNIKDS